MMHSHHTYFMTLCDRFACAPNHPCMHASRARSMCHRHTSSIMLAWRVFYAYLVRVNEFMLYAGIVHALYSCLFIVSLCVSHTCTSKLCAIRSMHASCVLIVCYMRAQCMSHACNILILEDGNDWRRSARRRRLHRSF